MSRSSKRRSNYSNLKANLLAERGDSCEYCMNSRWVDPHHCIIHQRKSNPELDCMENVMAVCRECHEAGVVNSWETRVVFYLVQKARGYDMDSWINSLPLKIKPDFSRYTWPPHLSSKDSYRILETPLQSLVQQMHSSAE